MGKTGKESLKRRVSECEPQNITVDVIQRVQRVTHGLDVVSVGEISSTAATFALWVSNSCTVLSFETWLLHCTVLRCLTHELQYKNAPPTLHTTTSRGVARTGPKGEGAHLKFQHFTRITPRVKGKSLEFGHFMRTLSRAKGVLEPPLPPPLAMPLTSGQC